MSTTDGRTCRGSTAWRCSVFSWKATFRLSILLDQPAEHLNPATREFVCVNAHASAQRVDEKRAGSGRRLQYYYTSLLKIGSPRTEFALSAPPCR